MDLALWLDVALAIEEAVGDETAEHRRLNVRLKVNTPADLIFRLPGGVGGDQGWEWDFQLALLEAQKDVILSYDSRSGYVLAEIEPILEHELDGHRIALHELHAGLWICGEVSEAWLSACVVGEHVGVIVAQAFWMALAEGFTAASDVVAEELIFKIELFIEIEFKTRIETLDRVHVLETVLSGAALRRVRLRDLHVAFSLELSLAEVVGETGGAEAHLVHDLALFALCSRLVVWVLRHGVVCGLCHVQPVAWAGCCVVSEPAPVQLLREEENTGAVLAGSLCVELVGVFLGDGVEGEAGLDVGVAVRRVDLAPIVRLDARGRVIEFVLTWLCLG